MSFRKSMGACISGVRTVGQFLRIGGTVPIRIEIELVGYAVPIEVGWRRWGAVPFPAPRESQRSGDGDSTFGPQVCEKGRKPVPVLEGQAEAVPVRVAGRVEGQATRSFLQLIGKTVLIGVPVLALELGHQFNPDPILALGDLVVGYAGHQRTG